MEDREEGGRRGQSRGRILGERMEEKISSREKKEK